MSKIDAKYRAKCVRASAAGKGGLFSNSEPSVEFEAETLNDPLRGVVGYQSKKVQIAIVGATEKS